MSTQASVRITTVLGTNAGQKLITAFEANLDPDAVTVHRQELPIRTIHPLEMVITIATGFLLEKLILEPLLNTVLEKFDWKNAVKKYRNPYQPFRLIIKITDENLEIETSPDLLEQQHIEAIWETINKIILLLKKENLHQRITKIRIISDKPEELLIIGYETTKPLYQLDLDNDTVSVISANLLPTEESQLDQDNLENTIKRHSERYQEYVARVRQSKNEGFE